MLLDTSQKEAVCRNTEVLILLFPPPYLRMFAVTALPDHLDFQGCQDSRVIEAFQVHLAMKAQLGKRYEREDG